MADGSGRTLARLAGNAGKLFGGGAIGAALGLLAALLAARHLGTGGFGAVVLAQSIVRTIATLLNFQLWGTIVRYGSVAREAGDRRSYGQLLKFGASVDVVSALVAAGVAVIAVLFAAPRLGWSAPFTLAAVLYGVSIAANLTGTPTGVLYLADRYGVFAYQRLTMGLIKAAGVTLVALSGGGAVAILAVMLVADLVSHLVVIVAGYREVRRSGHGDFLATPLAGLRDHHPGIIRFAVWARLNAATRTVVRDVDNLVVATLLSVDSVAVYKVAKQFGDVLQMLIQPISQAVYPDLARAVAETAKRRFRALLVETSLLGSVPAVLAVFGAAAFGELAIVTIVGPEYAQGRGVLVWYMAGLATAAAGCGLVPALMALGRVQWTVLSSGGAVLVYLIAVGPLVTTLGLAGAGAAIFVHYGVQSLALAGAVRVSYRAW